MSNETCNADIVINIDEANKAQQYETKEELFQIEAYEKVAQILKEHSTEDTAKDITRCRAHNTIFIDGDRGVGKTAFMVNLDNYYNRIDEDEQKNEYIFLNPIDPTLLEHTEKFLSVVLARIVETVSWKIKNKTEDENMEPYYSSLEKLSSSLEAIKTLPEDLGIEEIASNKSSLKLEQHAHEFFCHVCKFFGVNALVLLIDDVDMAFDKGFDVLEVVRKYLASPFLVPVVAGDMKLYREIVETRFMAKIEFQNDIQAFNSANHMFQKRCLEKTQIMYEDKEFLSCDYKEIVGLRNKYFEKKSLLENLIKQYLKKLFPIEFRIELKDIFTILQESKTAVKFGNNFCVPYTEIKDFEIRHINLGINQRRYTYTIFENNTRSVVQYLFSKKNIYQNFFEKQNFKTDDCKYQKYNPQKVMTKYDEDIVRLLFNDSNLYKKSFQLTSQVYRYEEGTQKQLSRLTNNDVKAYLHGSYSIYEAFLGDVFESNSKVKTEEGKEELFVHYEVYKSKLRQLKPKDKFILDLFAHGNYYHEANETKQYLLAGNFIELIFYSLGLDTAQIYLKDGNEKQLEELVGKVDVQKLKSNIRYEELMHLYDFADVERDITVLDDIAYKVPFNSEFRKNKNFKDIENVDAEDIDDQSSQKSIEHKNDDLKKIYDEIVIWKKTLVPEIKINSLLMYEIIHKVFNNLAVLKDKSAKLKEETPLKFIIRIVLIFINAVAFFENTTRRVAETNIAMADQFDMEILFKNNNAYNQNIKPLIEKKSDSLTYALLSHPIICYLIEAHDKQNNHSLSNINHRPMPKEQDKIKSSDDLLAEAGFKSGIRENTRIEVMKKLETLVKKYNLSRRQIENLKNNDNFMNLTGKSNYGKEYQNIASSLRNL
ncbi:MAG: hypothetical protein ACQESP_12355 [Candidatus Muiribacteriota bacterium]